MNCQKIWGLKCDLFINVKKKQISLNLMVKKKLYFLNVSLTLNCIINP